ncbi:hypothetical protein C8R43DRAFT_946932 [Mycena crocata]|nr:hypothetical protein C8R43DRAFT_946932 [Mycena crocata]
MPREGVKWGDGGRRKGRFFGGPLDFIRSGKASESNSHGPKMFNRRFRRDRKSGISPDFTPFTDIKNSVWRKLPSVVPGQKAWRNLPVDAPQENASSLVCWVMSLRRSSQSEHLLCGSREQILTRRYRCAEAALAERVAGILDEPALRAEEEQLNPEAKFAPITHRPEVEFFCFASAKMPGKTSRQTLETGQNSTPGGPSPRTGLEKGPRKSPETSLFDTSRRTIPEEKPAGKAWRKRPKEELRDITDKRWGTRSRKCLQDSPKGKAWGTFPLEEKSRGRASGKSVGEESRDGSILGRPAMGS